jgi:hypothetical protein
MRTLVLILIAGLVGACDGPDEVAVPPAGDEPTARELLAEQPRFTVSSVDQAIQLTARIDRGDRWVEDDAVLTLESGDLVISEDAGGDLVVETVDLYLGDITAGAGIIGDDGIQLTGLHVYTGAASTCHLTEWAGDDDSCFALATAALTLDWSLRIDDEVYGIGSQSLDEIALGVGLHVDDGLVVVDVTAAAPGVFWDWAGIVELTDLSAVLHGTQMPMVW